MFTPARWARRKAHNGNSRAAETGSALREVRDREAVSLTHQGRKEPGYRRGGTNTVDGLTDSGDRPMRTVDGKNRQQKRHALVAISM